MRLRILVARPIARGRNRLIVGPSSAWTALTYRSSPTSSWLCSAFATADSSSLLQSCATARGVMSQDSSRLLHRLSADVVAHEPGLARRRPHVLGLSAHDRRRSGRPAEPGDASAPEQASRLPRPRGPTPPPPSRLRRGFRLGLIVLSFALSLLLVLIRRLSSSSSSSSGVEGLLARRAGSDAHGRVDGLSVRRRLLCQPSERPGSRRRPKPVASPQVPRAPSASAEREASDAGASADCRLPAPALGLLLQVSLVGLIASYPYLHALGTAASAQTRRACAPPSTPR